MEDGASVPLNLRFKPTKISYGDCVFRMIYKKKKKTIIVAVQKKKYKQLLQNKYYQ